MNTSEYHKERREVRSSEEGAISCSENEMIDDSIANIESAVVATMSNADALEYTTARECSPPVVFELESNPQAFLRVEKFNVEKTALRLVSYWRLRRTLCDANHAYLPLNITGLGLLNDLDLDIINSGSIQLLPNTRKGQPVILVDRSRFDKTMSRETADAILRCAMYVCTLLLEDPRSQEEGVAILVNLQAPPSAKDQRIHDWSICSRLVDAVERALPILVHSIHFVLTGLEAAETTLPSQMVSLAIDALGPSYGRRMTFHHSDIPREVVRRLKSHGFSKAGIPTNMGGTWGDDKFPHWLKRQLRLEEDKYLDEDELQRRRRKMNQLYSKQKRDRRRIEVEVLQEQCSMLRAQRDKLAGESKRLHQLLIKANALVEESKLIGASEDNRDPCDLNPSAHEAENRTRSPPPWEDKKLPATKRKAARSPADRSLRESRRTVPTNNARTEASAVMNSGSGAISMSYDISSTPDSLVPSSLDESWSPHGWPQVAALPSVGGDHRPVHQATELGRTLPQHATAAGGGSAGAASTSALPTSTNAGWLSPPAGNAVLVPLDTSRLRFSRLVNHGGNLTVANLSANPSVVQLLTQERLRQQHQLQHQQQQRYPMVQPLSNVPGPVALSLAQLAFYANEVCCPPGVPAMGLSEETKQLCAAWAYLESVREAQRQKHGRGDPR